MLSYLSKSETLGRILLEQSLKQIDEVRIVDSAIVWLTVYYYLMQFLNVALWSYKWKLLRMSHLVQDHTTRPYISWLPSVTRPRAYLGSEVENSASLSG